FQSRNIATACHDDIGFTAAIVAGPVPDAEPGFAVLDRLVHCQPLGRWLFAGDEYVDVVAASQAVIGNGKQTVRIGREIDPYDFRLLVYDVIDETRVLMTKAVVILPPDVT